MKITINGETTDAADGSTIAALLETRVQRVGVAVAINGEFVPRSLYGERILLEGDEIEIVAPMQGG